MEAMASQTSDADQGSRGPRPPTASELRQALKTACVLAATLISVYCLHHALAFIGDEGARLKATEQRTMNNYWTTSSSGSSSTTTNTGGFSYPMTGPMGFQLNSRRHNYDRSKVPVLSDQLQALAELHLGQVEASLVGRGARSQPTSPKALASADASTTQHPDQPVSASQEKETQTTPEKPNFVQVLFDDAGYGDLGVHASEHGDVSHTPFLDRFAKSSLRLLDFYVTASICTPSRASLLTGRYGPRSGVNGHVPPQSRGGLAPTEQTLAAVLKPAGYRSLVVGKWHLGHVPPHDPLSHGFDEWLGLPFSSDMGCTDAPLGTSNPELPDTPALKACPLRSSTISSSKKQKRQDEKLKSAQSPAMNSSSPFTGIPDTTRVKRTWPWRQSELATSQDYGTNKWVVMGHGDPTVLPLYHACAPPGDHGRCGRCFKAIAQTINQTRTAAKCKNVDLSSRTGSRTSTKGSARSKGHWDFTDIWKQLKVAATVDWSDAMTVAGDDSGDLRGERSGMGLGSATGGASSRRRRCRHHQSSSGVGSHAIREQPASLWTLSDRLVGRAESFIMEHARPPSSPSRSSSDHPDGNINVEGVEAVSSEKRNGRTSKDASEKKKKKNPEMPPPFLLYFPLVHTHVPHTPHQRFVDQSRAALDNKLHFNQDQAHDGYDKSGDVSQSHLGRSSSYDGGVRNQGADESVLTTENHDDNEGSGLNEGANGLPMASRIKRTPLVPSDAHNGPHTAAALLRGRPSGGRMGGGQHRLLSASTHDAMDGGHHSSLSDLVGYDDEIDSKCDNHTLCIEGPRRGGGGAATLRRAPSTRTSSFGKKKSKKEKPLGMHDSRSRQEVKEDQAMVAHELAVQYGASLREADDMVRRVVAALERAHVAHNTLTIVTSDNGPWLIQANAGGSPLPYRGGKFSTLDGGVRVFALMHWPRVLGSQDHSEHPSLAAPEANQGTQNSDETRSSSGSSSSSSGDSSSESTSTSNSHRRRTTSSGSSGKKKRSKSRPGKHRSLVWGDERGVVSNALCSAVDLLPTLAAAAGVGLPNENGRSFDGEDLGPLLSLAGAYRHRHAVRFSHERLEDASSRKADNAVNVDANTPAANLPRATTSDNPGVVVTTNSTTTTSQKSALTSSAAVIAADTAHQKAAVEAAWLQRRVVFIQEGGNFAAMRVGRYKIAGLPRLSIQPIAISPEDAGTSTSTASGRGSHSGSSNHPSSSSSSGDEADVDPGAPELTIYDLGANPGEHTKLDTSANARFYLSRPAATGSKQFHDNWRNLHGPTEETTSGDGVEDDGEEIMELTAREMVAVAVYIKEAHRADVRGTFHSAPHNAKGTDAAKGLPCAHPYAKGAFCATCPCSSSTTSHRSKFKGQSPRQPRAGPWKCPP